MKSKYRRYHRIVKSAYFSKATRYRTYTDRKTGKRVSAKRYRAYRARMRQYSKARLYTYSLRVVERHHAGEFKYFVIRQWTRKYEKQPNAETWKVFDKLAEDATTGHSTYVVPNGQSAHGKFEALSMVSKKQVDKDLWDKEPHYYLEDDEEDNSPVLGDNDSNLAHEEDVEPSAQTRIDAI